MLSAQLCKAEYMEFRFELLGIVWAGCLQWVRQRVGRRWCKNCCCRLGRTWAWSSWLDGLQLAAGRCLLRTHQTFQAFFGLDRFSSPRDKMVSFQKLRYICQINIQFGLNLSIKRRLMRQERARVCLGRGREGGNTYEEFYLVYEYKFTNLW